VVSSGLLGKRRGWRVGRPRMEASQGWWRRNFRLAGYTAEIRPDPDKIGNLISSSPRCLHETSPQRWKPIAGPRDRIVCDRDPRFTVACRCTVDRNRPSACVVLALSDLRWNLALAEAQSSYDRRCDSGGLNSFCRGGIARWPVVDRVWLVTIRATISNVPDGR
jgi:hypothetical protein